MSKIAIVCVGYNRRDNYERLVSSLQKVDYLGRTDVDLILSIDYSGDSSVSDFANEVVWPFGKKIVRAFQERQGLAKHMMQCFQYAEAYDAVAVIEDDLYVSDSFYSYVSQACEKYGNEDRIAGFSLYSFQKNWLNWLLRFEPINRFGNDAFFMRLGMSWGEVMTTSQWLKFKKWMEGNPIFYVSDTMPQILREWPASSWLKVWDKYCIETNRFLLYPYQGITTNFSEAGTHNDRGSVADYQVPLYRAKKDFKLPDFSLDTADFYDEFMNPLGLHTCFGISEEEWCCDFYRTKPLSLRKRFLLSTDLLPYQVIESMGLCMRPIEENVLRKISGSGIFLYDCSKRDKKPKGTRNDLLVYSIRSHDAKQLRKHTRWLSRKIFKMRLHSLRAKIRRRLKK